MSKGIKFETPRKFEVTITKYINHLTEIRVAIFENNNSSSLIKIGDIPNLTNVNVAVTVVDYLGNIGVAILREGILYAKLPTVSYFAGYIHLIDKEGKFDSFINN
mgnify:CR=1 FL=1